jgi:hypothetical protein
MRPLALTIALAAGVCSALLTFGFTAGANSTPDAPWMLPIEPNDSDGLRLIEPYRQPNSDYSAGHRGVDYQVILAQAVMAPSGGQVWFRGRVVNRDLITIRHNGGLLTELEPVCSDLNVGDRVSMGQVIGQTCAADSNYSHCKRVNCLHFSLRRDGAYLSPLALIGGLAPSRLLPFWRT